MVGAFFVLLVLWLFISQWLRVTVFVSAIMVWLVISPLLPSFTLWPAGQPTTAEATPAATTGGTTTAAASTSAAASGDIPPQTEPPTSANLSNWLKTFYASEQKRKTSFPAQLPEDAQPFDLLVINICSLSWSDIEAAGLMDHPLWKHFDIVFKNFNSATSYSGPAAVRLLRASCGQLSHSNLYQPSGSECYLFENLAKLGFTQQLMLGHNGVFGDFLKEVRSLGGMQSPLMDQSGLPVILQGFDGSPVYDDQATLDRWLQSTEKLNTPRTATFYNTLPLHDGNHYPGQSKTADYKARAQKFFDELDAFFTELEKSGRKVMVVVVPEHGGALKGDKMQVSGLRDIPSPSITNVPAAVKFFGMKAPHQAPRWKSRSLPATSRFLNWWCARWTARCLPRITSTGSSTPLTCRRPRRYRKTPTLLLFSIRANPTCNSTAAVGCHIRSKDEKAAGGFLRPVRAQIANAADSRPPVRHFWLCIQLTIILTTMPAIIGAARSSHKIRPNCVSVIEPPVLQWQPFAAIFNLSGVVDSPRSVAG